MTLHAVHVCMFSRVHTITPPFQFGSNWLKKREWATNQKPCSRPWKENRQHDTSFWRRSFAAPATSSPRASHWTVVPLDVSPTGQDARFQCFEFNRGATRTVFPNKEPLSIFKFDHKLSPWTVFYAGISQLNTFVVFRFNFQYGTHFIHELGVLTSCSRGEPRRQTRLLCRLEA